MCLDTKRQEYRTAEFHGWSADLIAPILQKDGTPPLCQTYKDCFENLDASACQPCSNAQEMFLLHIQDLSHMKNRLARFILEETLMRCHKYAKVPFDRFELNSIFFLSSPMDPGVTNIDILSIIPLTSGCNLSSYTVLAGNIQATKFSYCL